MGSLNKKRQERCKVEELSGSDPGSIEDEINSKLAEGWIYADIFSKGNKVFIVFIK